MERHGLNAVDRPDIVCRVFKIKLDLMMNDFKKGDIFGPAIAGMYSIEIQKRGLPHAHILLWLTPFPPERQIDIIDGVISAEIPDLKQFPNLHAVVSSFTIHGPCGNARRRSPCMQNGRCTKFFPRKFSSCTYIDDDGYPVYMRRDIGANVDRGGILLDNRFVVPYCPYLLMKYRAHINIEFCNQSNAIKYLFKYVSKRPDRVTVVFENASSNINRVPSSMDSNVPVDEIKQYYDCRYLWPCEAVWRIFVFKIHERWPCVQRLTFHLPGKQLVYFGNEQNIDTVGSRARLKRTMFLAWMEANSIYNEGKELTYAEFPTQFVFCPRKVEWHPRQQGNSIGRLSFVPPGSHELYYLRLLLNVQRGCTSFDAIKSVDGVLYPKFEDACSALGLLANDGEFVAGIRESYMIASGLHLRRLFAALLMANSISKPSHVWQETCGLLSDDIYRAHRSAPNGYRDSRCFAVNVCLRQIENILCLNVKSLKDFPGMPYPEEVDPVVAGNIYLENELSYDVEEMKKLHEHHRAKLNRDQLHAYQSIVEATSSSSGGFFFVYGHGGTGKTFIWNTLSYYFRAKRQIVLNVASRGIASLLLLGGRTTHSLFSIPINLDEDSCCNIKRGSLKAQLIQHAALIIWDEAPMVHRWAFEALDSTLRDIMGQLCVENEHRLFGVKTVVLGGDFRQILPVVPRGNRATIVMSCVNSSPIWKHCTVIRLTQNMRLSCSTDPFENLRLREFAKWLLDIGDGKLGVDCDGHASVSIPRELCLDGNMDPISMIVASTYPDLLSHVGDFHYFESRAILAPRLDVVDQVNAHVLSLIPGELKEYLSVDWVRSVDEDVGLNVDWVTPEFINQIKLSGFSNHKLQMKVGVPIMLLQERALLSLNLDIIL